MLRRCKGIPVSENSHITTYIMYKSRLQEFCQRRSWELPRYSIAKEGLDHQPRFTASVNVNGQVFGTAVFCRSSKEAQNSAAQIAFDHFNTPPPQSESPATPAAVNSMAVDGAPAAPVAAPLAVDPSALIPAVAISNSDTAPISVAPPSAVDPPPSPLPELPVDLIALPVSAVAVAPPSELPAVDPIGPPASAIVVAPLPELPAVDPIAPPAPVVVVALPPDFRAIDAVAPLDMPHIYKNQLQQYTIRENLGLPVYNTKGEGPPHNCRFKSTVSVGGKSYQTSESFPSLKEAEQVAAKVACEALSVKITQEFSGGGLYKNMLQEFAQKRGLLVPSYETTSSGLFHNLVFVSIVEIGEFTFRGAEAKTKKQAEMSAARVAYCTLAKGCLATESSQVLCTDECPVADNLIQINQPTATTKNHRDARDEDVYLHAKRAKPSTERVNVDTPSTSNFPSAVSNAIEVKNSSTTVPVDRVVKPMLGDGPSLQCTVKTVVFPRKSDLPIPEGATVMPFSDDQWVAYQIADNQA